MSQAEQPASLTALQGRLDSLDAGQELTIARTTYQRLFGPDDVGSGRLANFAAGHGCTTSQREESVTFHKAIRGED